ncbi:hypothetical protein O4J56_25220 [Nocardiopsis sp. RSe5-2]|uniref:Uncharacterized protein n=1 Tax=Nocardiopsis endophytica TaxID=3018445 RepID=A0ABT4UAH5_9ACTN|nr:hypothetical protein [Nocardiopsis endophytica]MDA2813971.1 hypothetical protein [Nocardiopsis endophytica]
MADFVFVGVAAAFFALCVAYVRGCDRIIAAGRDADASAEEADHRPAHDRTAAAAAAEVSPE